MGLISGFGKIPWSRKWQRTPVVLPGKFHEERSLVCYSAWGHKEADMIEQLSKCLTESSKCLKEILSMVFDKTVGEDL